MDLRKVTAVVRGSALKDVEQRLREIHVPGISVSKVKGYGEYANFFTQDWMTLHARVEIFTTADRVEEIVRTIVAAAQSGSEGDGIVVVLPVHAMYRVRDGAVTRSGDPCACGGPPDGPSGASSGEGEGG